MKFILPLIWNFWWLRRKRIWRYWWHHKDQTLCRRTRTTGFLLVLKHEFHLNCRETLRNAHFLQIYRKKAYRLVKKMTSDIYHTGFFVTFLFPMQNINRSLFRTKQVKKKNNDILQGQEIFKYSSHVINVHQWSSKLRVNTVNFKLN